MPESDVYKAAVEIGSRSKRRLQYAVAITLVAMLLISIASAGYSTYESRQLHNGTLNQARRVAALVAVKTARSQDLVVAGVQGIRCVLRVTPADRTQAEVNHCFKTFDALNVTKIQP